MVSNLPLRIRIRLSGIRKCFIISLKVMVLKYLKMMGIMMTCYEHLRKKSKQEKDNGFYHRLHSYFDCLDATDFVKEIDSYHKKRGR